MTQRLFLQLVALVFFFIAIVHTLRLVERWDVSVEGYKVPLWVSAIVVVVALIFGLRSAMMSLEPRNKK